MKYQRKTLRGLTPDARKLAKFINELDSVTTRLANLMPIMAQYERESHALANHKCPPGCPHYAPGCPFALDIRDKDLFTSIEDVKPEAKELESDVDDSGN